MGNTEGELKVVLVDEDKQRKNLIKSYLPSYMDVYEAGYGDEAIEAMLPDGENKTDLVIMYADDRRGRSLYTFDKMNTENRDKKLFMIPVLLITKDEFSDRAMEFLEIGDAQFFEYQDEIDEADFFHSVMDALEGGEIVEEDDFPSFPPEYAPLPTSPDRIMGKSFSVANEEGVPQRSALIHGESRVQEILKAVAGSRKKAAFVKAIIEKALLEPVDEYDYGELDIKPGKSGILESGIIPSKSDSLESGIILGESDSLESGIILGDSDTLESGIIPSKLDISESGIIPSESDIIDSGIIPSKSTDLGYGASSLSEKLKKKKILIVDPDRRTEKACQLFLDGYFEFILLDSGTKAVDFFAENKADVMLIEYELPSVNGATIIQEIRKQTNGRSIPAVMMFAKGTPSNIISSVMYSGKVIATVSKPITKKELTAAVNTCLKFR